jgi:hypothetical protein
MVTSMKESGFWEKGQGRANIFTLMGVYTKEMLLMAIWKARAF